VREADARSPRAPGTEVLDIGGGLGGPARTLAAEFGCRVTVLDLTEAYCRIGETLTARTGLGARVSFRCASALDMPFEDARFDVVWTQHSTMNIEDKERLYREAYRVLRPGGRLASHEIAAGANQPIHFPVPWATHPGTSLLRTIEQTRQVIAAAAFEETVFHDRSESTLAWFRARFASLPDPLPPLGLHLLLGENFEPAFTNLIRNLEENRVAVIEALHRKP
jgi:ubiquinone/menaquinone biosynthesis C-methylase UbiE